jgi:DNA repair ATPase RecN
MTLNEKDYEDIYNNSQEVIWDKSNYNNIVAYLQEITMFSLHLDGLNLQQHVREQVLNNSATLNRIDRLQKTWDRINLNLDLNFNATVLDNLLAEVDKSLNDVAKDFNEVNNHTYDNKEEILVALSNATNHLNELKDRLQTMVV